ncbi:CGNR zinc finger domain-containing protein [Saccharopolyspora sp. K220]|uniref:CGNR zinc finger domain-containing protein n=1 Tax=Saccharopolyspora soli TaxID=2926618 RepID=UPI001F56415D|nr:CGNR zinc finger domain-containing protein [Saccharopolyspora soli]MCI2419194.1 CGNR zinc finger domain-containing protein [Saccharopolyspora soli]
MRFNDYGGEAARLAADLVNATGPLTSAQVESILSAHGVAESSLAPEHVEELTRWCERLADCFDRRDLRQRCEVINRMLADAASQPYISLHDGHPHLHYSSPDADAAARIRAITAAGLAYVVCFAGADRLGRCAREACDRAFVDTSRNGRRTYCSLRCANNDAVARHRAKHR